MNWSEGEMGKEGGGKATSRNVRKAINWEKEGEADWKHWYRKGVHCVVVALVRRCFRVRRKREWSWSVVVWISLGHRIEAHYKVIFI